MHRGEELLKLSDEEFGKIVDADIRLRDEDGHPLPTNPALRNSRVAMRWYNHLIASKKNIEGQFGARKMRLTALQFEVGQNPDNDYLQRKLSDERVRYANWKAGALSFNSGLEARIQECRRFLPREDDPMKAMHELVVLRAAIRRHKENIDPEDASRADLELWQLV